MDNKLVIQLLTSKTEEIQNLLKHFVNEPKDLHDGIELLESRIQGLSQDFKILKRNCEINQRIESTTPEKKAIQTSEPLPTNENNIDLETEISREVKTELVEPIATIKEELPIIETVVEEEHVIEDKKEIDSPISLEKMPTEPLQLIGEKIASKKLIDIQSAIGINDRFLFTRELFENNIEEYNTAISFVNKTDKFESVMNWIKTEKKWDLEDPTVVQFVEITKRKF